MHQQNAAASSTESTPLLLQQQNNNDNGSSASTTSHAQNGNGNNNNIDTTGSYSVIEGRLKLLRQSRHYAATATKTNTTTTSSSRQSSTSTQQRQQQSGRTNGSSDKTLRQLSNEFRTTVQNMSTRLIQYVAHHTGSIGMLGSMSIAINSLTGPAMLNLPATYVRSGIIPTTCTLLFVCYLSSRCSLHMANTISKVPENKLFTKEVEYSDAFRHFFQVGQQQWYYSTQIIFTCCITCLNISSIVDTSQVVDLFIGNWIPTGTAAFLFFSTIQQEDETLGEPDNDDYYRLVQLVRWNRSVCSIEEVDGGTCLPFADTIDDDGILITLGTIITTVFFLPLALCDLKENAWWQVAGFAVLMIVSLQFIIQFALSDGFLQFNVNNHLTWWGNDWNDMLGVIIFNFALVIAIPAWLYEREPHVDVPTVINSSSCVVVVLYMLIGLFGAMAIPHVADNMLESMMSGAFGTMISLSASLFAFAIVGLGIPLFSVLTRLNLTGSGLCSQHTGNLIAVYIPFGAAWLLYDGQAITKLLSWGGIIFTSLVAFILPLILSIHVVRTTDTVGSILVYGGWYEEKKSHLISLYVLIFLACFAIFMAILGNLVDFDGTPDENEI